ncbi:hypothetical protein NEOLEDRAFT_1142915 [Neolentinus lepideus HHB14362 ss-1]|uniref:Uncharacterized protein n=1 Tax=Neolentinus lepideus HHB14362 ss-1 TaxID=1314782 RepID=A0A165MUN6_9AGAM|nr:hypothetical protein NEOLEDRAFT_1142915 [Neolentinus lepideus HHB14362 ss-1]
MFVTLYGLIANAALNQVPQFYSLSSSLPIASLLSRFPNIGLVSATRRPLPSLSRLLVLTFPTGLPGRPPQSGSLRPGRGGRYPTGTPPSDFLSAARKDVSHMLGGEKLLACMARGAAIKVCRSVLYEAKGTSPRTDGCDLKFQQNHVRRALWQVGRYRP